METKIQKPATGRLLHLLDDGRDVVLAKDLPFWQLQKHRKEYIRRGLKKENLKITY